MKKIWEFRVAYKREREVSPRTHYFNCESYAQAELYHNEAIARHDQQAELVSIERKCPYSNKWLKEDDEFANKVIEIENISKDFVKSKYYECVKDKVPSVVIHAAKTKLGWNETNSIDITSGNKPINMPVITFVETDTE